jgi:hypothetical protein
MQQLKALFSNLGAKSADAREIAVRSLRLATKPSSTGSVAVAKIIGMSRVAALAANATGREAAMIAAGLRLTRSAASAGSRSIWPSAVRYSTVTLRPSEKPTSAKPRRNASTASGPRPLGPHLEPADGRLRLRLCPDKERTRHRATDPRNELPPFHSITSSAIASRFGGMVRPSALAVFTSMRTQI